MIDLKELEFAFGNETPEAYRKLAEIDTRQILTLITEYRRLVAALEEVRLHLGPATNASYYIEDTLTETRKVIKDE